MNSTAPSTSSPPSLERLLIRRLSALYAGAFTIVLVIYLILAWSFRHVEITNEMGDLAVAVAHAIRNGHDGKPHLDVSSGLESRLGRFANLEMGITDMSTGQQLVSSTTTLFHTVSPVDAIENLDGDFFLLAEDGMSRYGTLRVVQTTMGKFRIELWRRGRAFSDAVDWIWEELVTETLPIFVPLAVATLLITWFTLRSTLHPLRRLSQEARGVREYSMGTRLNAADIPLEILPVVAATNDALERVENALRQQRRFMANVAHELRTPLAVLRARVENLGGPVLMTLNPDIDRMSRLVDRLLAVARLEATHLPFDSEFELVAAVRECLAQIAPLAIAQQKDLVLSAPETPITVRGNAIAFDQALRNLIDNALRFTPAGKAIEVTIFPGSAVEVRDHGPGVPKEFINQIFEPFWRGDNEHGGLGLGLAIVAETARLHSGRLTVSNVGEGGAIFRMDIPEIA